MRARSNELFRNTPHVKKFINLCKKNITGPFGFKLSMDIRNPDESRDSLAEKKIREAWERWCTRENCTISGDMTFRDVQNLAITSAVRDGEFLARLIPNPAWPFGCRLELIESNMLDETYNTRLNNGNVVRMGVEMDAGRRPQAYWIKKVKADLGYFQIFTLERERVDAKAFFHVYDKLWITQTRGVPWYVAAMIDLHFLRQYKFAGLVNTRANAERPYWITEGENTPNKALHDNVDENGNFEIESEPGKPGFLPFGYDLKSLPGDFPTPQHGSYVKGTLKDIAAGMDASYASVSGDMTEANYSSTRWGAIDERDGWMLFQTWFIESFLERVFSEWLFWALGTGYIQLPTAYFDKFNNPVFVGRIWPWVDPEKDVAAKGSELRFCMTSLKQVTAERGDDLEKIFRDIEETNKLAQKYGITLNFDPSPKTLAPPANQEEPQGAGKKPSNGAEKKNGKDIMKEALV